MDDFCSSNYVSNGRIALERKEEAWNVKRKGHEWKWKFDRIRNTMRTGDEWITRKKVKNCHESFFFFRANELTVHSMYSVDRNLVIWSRDNKSCRRYARSSSCSSFLGCRLNTPGVIASKYFWKRQLRDRGMRRGFVRHEKNSFSLFLPSNSPF